RGEIKVMQMSPWPDLERLAIFSETNNSPIEGPVVGIRAPVHWWSSKLGLSVDYGNAYVTYMDVSGKGTIWAVSRRSEPQLLEPIWLSWPLSGYQVFIRHSL